MIQTSFIDQNVQGNALADVQVRFNVIAVDFVYKLVILFVIAICVSNKIELKE